MTVSPLEQNVVRSRARRTSSMQTPVADTTMPSPNADVRDEQEYEQEPNLTPAGVTAPSTDSLDEQRFYDLFSDVLARVKNSRPSLPRRNVHIPSAPLFWFAGGMVGLVLVYTLAFFIASFGSKISDQWSYGPTHTYNADLMLAGKPGHVTAVNLSGTVQITLTQTLQGKVVAQMLVSQVPSPEKWGDLRAITVTVSPDRDGTLHVHLAGAMSYTNLFFARPVYDFRLMPQKDGTYVVAG